MSTPQLGERNAGPSTKRPKQIDQSVQFWLASLILNLVGHIVNALTPSAEQTAQLRRLVREQSTPIPDLTIEDYQHFVQATLVIAAVILGGLWLGCILAMRNGHRWARATLAVLGWFAVIIGMQQIGVSTGSAAVFIAMSLCTIIGVALMFRGEAVQYFQKPNRK